MSSIFKRALFRCIAQKKFRYRESNPGLLGESEPC
ncbi:unnamed protein product [Debaryomyces tyrocola]|nr:unnamed protein product [Debaryomyces tyrocola]